MGCGVVCYVVGGWCISGVMWWLSGVMWWVGGVMWCMGGGLGCNVVYGWWSWVLCGVMG
jgi:hypothetical protein